MADFAPAFEKCLRLEGGYRLTHVPGDRGGQTYAGISRRHHPDWPGWAEIDAGRQPDADAVRHLYHARFWDPSRLDLITSQRVAESIFCGLVNQGSAAAKMLQVTLGATPDGIIGPRTMLAINSADPDLLLARFTVAKIARYHAIVSKDRSQGKFLLGWISRALQEG